MSREDMQKLLGGYATGTLTPEERDALFVAALEDQELFDALMREEPLREVLQDPVAKNHLRAVLTVPVRTPWHHRWLRPAVLAAMAAGIVGIGVVMVEQHAPPRPIEIAKVETARPPAVVLPAPEPAAATEAPKPSPAKASPRRQEALKTPEAQQTEPPHAKGVELRAAQPKLMQALKQAAAENKTETNAAIPAALPAAPPVDVQAGLQIRPAAGLPATGPRAGFGGAIYDLRDARALFSQPPVAPTFRSNLVRAESRGPARAEAVSAPVADAVLAPAAHLGLRYTVWQRPPGGMFEQVSLDAGLNAGDEIELQLQPNDLAYLYVLERGANGAWNLLATDRPARMAVYTVPQSGSLRPGDSGLLELFVLLSRQPLSEQERQPVSPVDQQVNGSPAERATYVASTASDPTAQRIGFPITLQVQSH